jgi:methionine salvage enolase-phosphatase E1
MDGWMDKLMDGWIDRDKGRERETERRMRIIRDIDGRISGCRCM